MTSPRVSVIVPVLNEAETLDKTLVPLQHLRQQGGEIILVDGGSHDGTTDVAAPLVDRVVNSPRGRALQMNAGAAEAKGKLLLFLHADTQLTPEALRALFRRVKRQPALWGRFDVIPDSDRWIFRLITRMMNLRSCMTGVVTGDQALFVQRALFRKAGGFPEIPLMEDITISKRLRKLQWPVCLQDKVVISTRYWQRHGALRSILRMWRLRLIYFLGASPDRLVRQYYREHG